MAETARRRKPDFSAISIPENRRRGSFIVRDALKQAVLKQHPSALKAAGRMLLLLPMLQAVILVGILNAEPWMLLLSGEGLLIAWLASSQLNRPSPENRLIGLGLGIVNLSAMAAVGAFLSSPLLWISSIPALVPFGWLLLCPTGARTVKVAWFGFMLPLSLLAVFAGYSRFSLERSQVEPDPAARLSHLKAAWHGLQIRGCNGAERALLRLRQAQAAFESADFEQAFGLANDGLQKPGGALRPIPRSPLGEDLLTSLLRLKAQSYYNHRWGRRQRIIMPIKNEALEEEMLTHQAARVRWGW